MLRIRLLGHRRHPRREGAVIVLAAIMMIGLMAFVACGVDLGFLLMTQTEMQRSADSAAIAAVWQFADEQPPWRLARRARRSARRYAALNEVLHEPPRLRRNYFNESEGDIVLGTVEAFGTPDPPLLRGDPAAYNAVKVRVRRTHSTNGEVPLFFARVLGLDSRATEVTATAAIMKRIGGFKPPESGENVPILPITVHIDDWEDLLAGDAGEDEWAYNEQDGSVSAGSDGVPEVFLFPQRNNSPGNFGTVDIGPASNGTSHLRGQIVNGISEADLEHHGGELKFDDSGELLLGGDPGISAGMESALLEIIGQKRIIPVYREVHGGGNTASYTIVRFVGVRLMEAVLSSGEKRIYVQPAKVVTRGTIPFPSDGTSDYVYSYATLVH